MTEIERRKIEKTFYIIGWGIFAILGILFTMQRVFDFHIMDNLVPCIFQSITGLYCPGCGGTRAIITMLEGRFLDSFFYHPLVPYGAAVVLWFMISHTMEKLSGGRLKTGMHYRNAYLWIALVLLVLNVLLKNAALFVWHVDLFQIIGQS